MTEKKSSNECFSTVDGKKVDALIHDEILANETARKELRADNIALAIELGMAPAAAERLYA